MVTWVVGWSRFASHQPLISGLPKPMCCWFTKNKEPIYTGNPQVHIPKCSKSLCRRSKDSLTPTSFGLNVKQRECTRIQTQRYCGCFETILVTVVTRHAASAQHLLTCQAFGTDHSNTRQDLGDYIQAPLWLFG